MAKESIKVGDRVRVNGLSQGYKGQIGTVSLICPSQASYDGRSIAFFQDDKFESGIGINGGLRLEKLDVIEVVPEAVPEVKRNPYLYGRAIQL